MPFWPPLASGEKVSFVFISDFSVFYFSRLSGPFPVRSAYPRANNQRMPTLERPTLERNAHIFTERLPWSYPGATLELPWSYPGARYLPVYPYASRLPWSYPRATLELRICIHKAPTLELPCTYPGAPTPALPRLPGRLPPAGLGRFFLPSPSPPPARPKAPGSPKTPPPPAYPGARLGPWPGPSRGLRTGGRPGRPGLGSRSNSHFPQK